MRIYFDAYGELGIADTVRFLRQFSAGFSDYTVQRSAQPDETLEEIIASY